MPLVAEHLKQAQHNEAFVNIFDTASSPYLDWALIGIFYSSVHYIEAFLATKNKHTRYHTSRDNYVEVYLGNIYEDYRELKDYSEDARYSCKTITDSMIYDGLDKLQNIKNQLKTIIPTIP